ncbi:MAG TPA: NADH-quinone oxidoreductase subunit J [Acidobacteriaceae bacterium]|nr:NADH-quinone oxidoreductase subunit J [Acidobacteriaceae bacterium]
MSLDATFLILAAISVAGSAAAMGLRNAVHCVLALTAGFAGIAGLYLYLGAQFVGFTQIMVYVGAVAILAVFAIMMTHHPGQAEEPFSRYWLWGAVIAAAVFLTLARAVRLAFEPAGSVLAVPPQAPDLTVQQIGEALMHRYVLPLEIIGLLLTAALIGAVIIAMDAKEDPAMEDAVE